MLKMGQMCHCLATLWKIDLETGEIVARADRGLLTAGLASYDDGTDIWLYESGAVTPAGFYVTKWKDDGAQFVKQWEVAPSGLSAANPLAYATDNHIWVADGGFQDIHRLSAADGSETNTANVANPAHYMVPGDSGEMFAANRGSAHFPSGTNLTRLDTSVFASVTLTNLFSGKCRLANSWFVAVNATPRLVREYDDTLTLVASASAPLITSTNSFPINQRFSDDGKVFCQELQVATKIRWRLMTVSTLSADWTISPHATTDTEPIGLTADGDVYVLAMGTAIYRLSGVDGSVVWSVTIGETGSGLGGVSYHLIRDGDLLLVVVSASSGKLLTWNGSTVIAMALDYTNGDVIWARGIEGSGRFIGGPHVIDGHLYVAGTRLKRAVEPDIFP